MEKLPWQDEDFEILDRCPWDGADAERAELLYQDDMGCDIVRCPSCGITYARKRLNEHGLPKYWGNYLSRVHIHDSKLTEQRNKMYKVDYDFSHLYVPSGHVLDVGCGNGAFMDMYIAHGYKATGVEYGREAAKAASVHHHVRYGIFSEMDFGEERFDLIIFRGVLQYIPDPKSYLLHAVHLLKKTNSSNHGGCLFITAQPNMNSFAAQLFGDKFGLRVTGSDFIGYTEPVLTQYLTSGGIGLRKIGERYFYEETPYADVENDILRMAEAIHAHREKKNITGCSPAFWGNMMTLMYEKYR